MHEEKVRRAYHLELFGSLFLYAAVLIPAISYGKNLPEGTLRTALMLAPMLPALLMVWAIARQFQRMDEYQRLMSLESFAISAAIKPAVNSFLISAIVIFPVFLKVCLAKRAGKARPNSGGRIITQNYNWVWKRPSKPTSRYSQLMEKISA